MYQYSRVYILYAKICKIVFFVLNIGTYTSLLFEMIGIIIMSHRTRNLGTLFIIFCGINSFSYYVKIIETDRKNNYKYAFVNECKNSKCTRVYPTIFYPYLLPLDLEAGQVPLPVLPTNTAEIKYYELRFHPSFYYSR